MTKIDGAKMTIAVDWDVKNQNKQNACILETQVPMADAIGYCSILLT